MAKKRKQDDPLTPLLETLPKAKLVDLLVHVANTRPAVRRECLDYLNRHTSLSPSRKKQSEGEKLLALWAELAPDLDELDAYGGGDYDADIHVSSLLQEIARALSRKRIDAGYRQKLLDNALPYIEGKGRMDELRQFVARRVKSAGNRERYLALQFDQAIDHLTCDKYKAFRKLCTATEWKRYEAKILARLENAWDTEQLRIRMHRKEYEEAVAVLSRSRYPIYAWDSAYELQTAKRLEGRYPEAILKYYLSGLGNLKTNAPRKDYARKAHVMNKVHRVLVDVLRDPSRWRDFALKVKKDNIRRPAFQEEFTKTVPGWQALK